VLPVGIYEVAKDIEKVLGYNLRNMENENMLEVSEKIKELADRYKNRLQEKIDNRIQEMKFDDKSHHLIYRVLGITTCEGESIDIYQNKGRFLYKYAGSFLEEATKLCFAYKFPDSKTHKIQNTEGKRPKTFEIDCLVEKSAIEIKWRDATTDGDHVTKEHTRIQAIKRAGYKPVRVMFYYPNREQAIKIQKALETLYRGIGGEYYFGDNAWKYVKEETDIDLKKILENIASGN
jgi:hypothetical protein